jgi:hypothetical protein
MIACPGRNKRVALGLGCALAMLTAPLSDARADSNPPQTPTLLGTVPDGYVSLFANYYQTLDGLLTIGEWVDNLASPQPSLADLIQQMETQIIAVIKSDRDDKLTWTVNGWTTRFHDIISNPQDALNLPPSQSVEDMLNDGSGVWTAMASIIATEGPDEAYRMAIPFLTMRALYVAMLQYEGESQATINEWRQMAIQTEYQLVGTTDGACAIFSGVNTEFDSLIFAAKDLALRAFDYYCDVGNCTCGNGQFCESTQNPNFSAPLQDDGYGCSQFRESSQSPVGVVCDLSFVPGTPAAFGASTTCNGIALDGESCIDQATAGYRFKFHHDLVTALVRQDLSLLLFQTSGSQTSAPLYCGQPLGLLPFGELCSAQSCTEDTMSQGKSTTQSSTATIQNDTAEVPAFSSSWAVDGVTAPGTDLQYTLTDVETNPWWQVDIGFSLPIGQILIWPHPPTLSNLVDTLSVTLEVTPDGTDPINNFNVFHVSQQTFPIVINANGYPGRYIRITGVGTGLLSLGEVQVLPYGDQPPMMTFESASAWQVQNGASATLSTTSEQGQHSLSVNAVGWTPIVSTPMDSLLLRAGATSSNYSAVSFALSIPTTQPNPSWIGAAQMYISSPSANIYNAYMGQVDLTPLPQGQFNRLAFTIPDYALPALKLDNPDVSFTIVLNVNPGTNGWLLDDLRIGG